MNEKFCIFSFTEARSEWSNWQQPRIGLDNDLAPNERKAIIWTNADPIHWRIYAALRGDELSHWNPVNLTNKVAADALAPCIARLAVAMVLTYVGYIYNDVWLTSVPWMINVWSRVTLGMSDLICQWRWFANHFMSNQKHVLIAGTLGCVFIDNETHKSGVTKCTTGEAWSAFSWHHSSVFHCQWTHNLVFLLLSHMLI